MCELPVEDPHGVLEELLHAVETSHLLQLPAPWTEHCKRYPGGVRRTRWHSECYEQMKVEPHAVKTLPAWLQGDAASRRLLVCSPKNPLQRLLLEEVSG